MEMKSMTAYASVIQKKDSQSVQVIIRALNFKYLDIAIHNLPIQNIILEEKIKKEIRKKIQRGKIEVFIFSKTPAQTQVQVNEDVIARYISQIKKIAKKYKVKTDIGISDILHLPQAIHWHDKKEKDESLILPALKAAMRRLMEFKEKQGKAIKNEMMKNVRDLKENAKKIKKHKPLVTDESNCKEDIDEEISLISFYVNKLDKKITADKPATKGRAIDFLTQEILRELNAASSKTKKKIAASLIVEAKSYVDRIREQAQNVE